MRNFSFSYNLRHTITMGATQFGDSINHETKFWNFVTKIFDLKLKPQKKNILDQAT